MIWKKVGSQKIASTLALKGLLEKELITTAEVQEWNSEPYMGYKFTNQGWGWVLKNQGKFLLKKIDKTNHP